MRRAGVSLAAVLALAACRPIPLATATPILPFPSPSHTASASAVETATPPPRFTATARLTQESQETAMPTILSTPTPLDPGLQRLVTQTQEDLARRLGVDVEQIDVVEVRAVVWPDTSLGCPQPGMRYLQVPQDGVLIRLSVEGTTYAYHGGGGREPFLCELKPPAPRPTLPRLDDYLPTPGSKSDT